jgi:UDP-glucose 4-epimerase
MTRKAVVFGGSGFIGSHVADLLSMDGYSVTIFDEVRSPWLRSDQNFITGDITKKVDVDLVIEGASVVYNFAALADLNAALKRPLDTININILGNAMILESCVKYKVERFVYASTVYVNSRDGGFYRCSKQASENYIDEYHKTYGLNYSIVRYGSLYGPRAGESNGLYRIVKSAIETGKVKYQGHPKSMREYIHVQDAARASVALLGEEFVGKTIVLTGQEPMLVSNVLEMIAEILGYQEDAVEFVTDSYDGHYIKTSYAYEPRLGMKYIPPIHVDLGQGILQLIKEIHGN